MNTDLSQILALMQLFCLFVVVVIITVNNTSKMRIIYCHLNNFKWRHLNGCLAKSPLSDDKMAAERTRALSRIFGWYLCFRRFSLWQTRKGKLLICKRYAVLFDLRDVITQKYCKLCIQVSHTIKTIAARTREVSRIFCWYILVSEDFD